MRSLRPLAILAAFAAGLAACESPDNYQERQDLQRERDNLRKVRDQMEAGILRETGGKTQLSEADKARLTPVFVEFNRVKGELADVEERLRDLNSP